MPQIFITPLAYVAVACLTLHGAASRADDVTVYKDTCTWDAAENWNLVCPVRKNTATAASDEASVWFANSFKNLKSITVCTSFTNRGGLNVPAIIVHNHDDGSQSKPTDLFDTIRFRGNIASSQMSWTGDRGTLVYSETLLNGQRIVGEIQATCRSLEDSGGSPK